MIGVIIQARLKSSRFPRKVLQSIGSTPVLEVMLRRLRCLDFDAHIVIATTSDPSDDELEEFAAGLGVAVYRGSTWNVLDRYVGCADHYGFDWVFRLTADCPLVDGSLLNRLASVSKARNFDYLSNTLEPTYPDGLDVELFSSDALRRSVKFAVSPFDKEHVTHQLKQNNEFNKFSLLSAKDYSDLRWTIDEPIDLEVVSRIIDAAGSVDLSFEDYIRVVEREPNRYRINEYLGRDHGAYLSTGQKVWDRAKRVMPSGGSLLSKRAEMLLPQQWPSYFSRTKDQYVWDLDGNKLLDFGYMGVGTNILGYSNSYVDRAVIKAIKSGNLSTLNCVEEVELIERLVALHPWADMGRTTRSGGEANAMAVRIGRAASGKDGVAFCGYHGWHDWYLSANLENQDALAGHLLPGLSARGIPKCLAGSAIPFYFNDLASLKEVLDTNEIGVIKLEVYRSTPPDREFLHGCAHLAKKHGAVLIVDECTSGFRATNGGVHLDYDFEPDVAIFGKTLGNGYAINAVIGKREVMLEAEKIFISSTFWTERIGPVAALATLNRMEELKSWEIISDFGRLVKSKWRSISERHGLDISILGLDALATFSFKSKYHLAYKTLITQMMLDRHILSANAVYSCVVHDERDLNSYCEVLDESFELIKISQRDNLDIASMLKGPVCSPGFRRLDE